MKRKIKLMIGVTVMSLLAQASTNSLASAYTQISTYRCGPVASADCSLFTSPYGLILSVR